MGTEKAKKWSDEADESYDLIFRRAAGILERRGEGLDMEWS